MMIIIIIECTEQVMRSETAHYLLTNTQPIPVQLYPLPQPTTPYKLLSMMPCYGISLWPIWVTCPVCVPSQLLVRPQPPC